VPEIEVSRTIAAPPERIWPLLADHEGMKKWAPVREVIRRRPGAPEPDGVGAVRTVRAFGMVVDERITAFEPGVRLGYTLVEGAPLRDHTGEIVLEPGAGGTRVAWRVRFRPLVPGTGWLLARVLRRGLERSLEGLRRRAEAP
jgi:uncharacterized protein YndB with AHSA1/START domain